MILLSAGWVSPVKNQHDCGSCVAFASMAAVETCFKKQTGVFGDYAEQEFIDCGFKYSGANGCDGAAPHAYLKWVTDKQQDLAHESQYPYLNLAPKLTCSPTMPVYRQGAKVNATFYTYTAGESLLQQLVHTYGAVITSVMASGPLQLYKGGIFAGCNPGNNTDHAVTVVGWGNAGGVDYWLIKNSWGPNWGEAGFIRLKRGVSMCGIGQTAVIVTCGPQAGTTDPPLTTARPCVDNYSNCPDLAVSYCYQASISSNCYKSCGLCPGMTPAKSNTCFDTYSNCNTLCGTSYKSVCKKSCGGC